MKRMFSINKDKIDIFQMKPVFILGKILFNYYLLVLFKL